MKRRRWGLKTRVHHKSSHMIHETPQMKPAAKTPQLYEQWMVRKEITKGLTATAPRSAMVERLRIP